MADRVQMQQALMNLMRNGIEAMQGTDGELRIKSLLGVGRTPMEDAPDGGRGVTLCFTLPAVVA
jgi:signal transduction histidine kinase